MDLSNWDDTDFVSYTSFDSEDETVEDLARTWSKNNLRAYSLQLHTETGIYKVEKLYNDLLTLNQELHRLFPSIKLSFPPLWTDEDEIPDADFLEERRTGLRDFMTNIMCHSSMHISEPVKSFWGINGERMNCFSIQIEDEAGKSTCQKSYVGPEIRNLNDKMGNGPENDLTADMGQLLVKTEHSLTALNTRVDKLNEDLTKNSLVNVGDHYSQELELLKEVVTNLTGTIHQLIRPLRKEVHNHDINNALTATSDTQSPNSESPESDKECKQELQDCCHANECHLEARSGHPNADHVNNIPTYEKGNTLRCKSSLTSHIYGKNDGSSIEEAVKDLNAITCVESESQNDVQNTSIDNLGGEVSHTSLGQDVIDNSCESIEICQEECLLDENITPSEISQSCEMSSMSSTTNLDIQQEMMDGEGILSEWELEMISELKDTKFGRKGEYIKLVHVMKEDYRKSLNIDRQREVIPEPRERSSSQPSISVDRPKCVNEEHEKITKGYATVQQAGLPLNSEQVSSSLEAKQDKPRHEKNTRNSGRKLETRNNKTKRKKRKSQNTQSCIIQ
ncbi:uncharacterized protein LOC100372080 [Saccoglossus kowalevskii]|uniref:Uncharacterized protein LOC100372080 n=1 Tax=Saccoglossus kowalevskii TaxID=10224 RepID=A0ABM0MHZ7_SACKO|nr:PREDICTED: uncharacterized protein LOC100372080 [Saccoglossus kowalevskii]